MDTSITLARIIGIALLLTGVTLFNGSYFGAVMYDFAHSMGLLWVTGFMTFVLGAVLVALHNMWCRDWRVIVTLLSWLMVIKGAVIMVIPQTMMTFYTRILSDHFLVFGGIYAVALGMTLLLLSSYARKRERELV